MSEEKEYAGNDPWECPKHPEGGKEHFYVFCYCDREAYMEKIKSLESRLMNFLVVKRVQEENAILKKFPFGCDNAEHMVDEIQSLEKRLSQAEAELAKYQSYAFCPVHQLKPDLTVVKCLICDQEEKARLTHLMDVAGKLSEWVEGYVDYLGHEDCGNECQQGELRKEMEKLLAEWDGIKKEPSCMRCNDNGCPACDGTKGSKYNPEPY